MPRESQRVSEEKEKGFVEPTIEEDSPSEKDELITKYHLKKDEVKLLEDGWTIDEILLKREGWERQPILNEKKEFIGWKMVKPYEEEYWKVIFAEKSNPMDTDDAHLTVNGESLIITRGVPVIIPKRFLLSADHGTHDVYRQLPGEPRKKLFKVQTYPYTVLEKGLTEKDYLAMKREGDKIQRDKYKEAENM